MSDTEINTAEPADIDSYVEQSGFDSGLEPERKPVEVNAGEQAVAGELLEHIVEGALLTAGKPLTIAELAALFEDHERPGSDALRTALAAIGERYAGRGFELREVASGYRFQVVQSVATWIARLWEEKPQRYSRALLETLALIAYRQPITRGDIEDIRGVAVASNIMKTLLEREWVRVVGHKDVPGRPAMYATTRKFLDYFNLQNLDDLPTLAEIRDLDSLNAELSLEGADTPRLEPVLDEEGAASDDSIEIDVADLAEAMSDLQPDGELAPESELSADAAAATEEQFESPSPEVDAGDGEEPKAE